MTDKISITSTIAGWILITVNFICMVVCVLLFTFTLWIIASPSSLSLVIQNFGSATVKALFPAHIWTVQLGVGTAVLSTLMFFIVFMGFYGAITRTQFMLFMYSTLVLLLLLLECALIYYFSSSLIEKGIQDQDGQWTHALRLAFKCCDLNVTNQEATKIPWSCCGSYAYPENCSTTEIHTKDCYQTISNWLDHYLTSIYASLAALHIIIATCSLLRQSRASRSHS